MYIFAANASVVQWIELWFPVLSQLDYNTQVINKLHPFYFFL